MKAYFGGVDVEPLQGVPYTPMASRKIIRKKTALSVCITRCDMWKRRVVNQHHQQSCTYVVGGRVGLNTGYITGVDMCKVCTEAVQSVALRTRVTLQVWTCVKYVLKQSSP